MADLMFPNIVDAYNQGAQTGRQLQFNQLAGQAYQAQPGQDRDALIAQMAGLDPGSADAVSKNLQNMQDIHDARIGAAANYVLQKWQQAKGNPDDPAVQGAYEAIKPVLNEYGSNLLNRQSAGDKFDPAALPHIYALASKYQYALNQKMPAAVQAMQYMAGQLGDAAPDYFRIKAGIDPRAVSPDYQQVKIPDGRGGTIQGFINKRTGQFETPDYSPVMGGSTTQSTPPGGIVPPSGNGTTLPNSNDWTLPLIQQANQRVQSGEDPNVVQADLVRQLQAGSTAQAQKPAPAANTGAGLGYTPPKQPGTEEIAKRQQEIAALQASGVKMSDAQKQQYLMTGKAGSPEDDAQSWDEGLSNAEKKIVQGLANYTIPTSSRFFQTPANQRLVARAMMLNPNFNAAQYGQNQKLISDLAANSPNSLGGGVQALNTAAAHVAEMANASKALPSHDLSVLNQIQDYVGQAAGTQTGAAVKSWNTAKALFSGEMAKAVKGGVASQAEVESLENNFDAASSPSQRAAALQAAAQFLIDRQNAMRDRRDQILGTNSPGTGFFTPRALNQLKSVFDMNGKEMPDAGGASATLGYKPAATPTAGATDFSHLWN